MYTAGAELAGTARARSYWTIESRAIESLAAMVIGLLVLLILLPPWLEGRIWLAWVALAVMLGGGPIALALGAHVFILVDRGLSLDGDEWHLVGAILGGLFLLFMSAVALLAFMFPGLD